VAIERDCLPRGRVGAPWGANAASQGDVVGFACGLTAGNIGALRGIAVARGVIPAAVHDAGNRLDPEIVIVGGDVAGQRRAGSVDVDPVVAAVHREVAGQQGARCVGVDEDPSAFWLVA